MKNLSYRYWMVFTLTLNLSCLLGQAQWMKTSGPGNSGNISSVAVFGDFLFASIEKVGIFRSSDHGDSWTQVQGFPIGQSGKDLLTVGGIDINRSKDNGNSWSLIYRIPGEAYYFGTYLTQASFVAGIGTYLVAGTKTE